MLEIQRGYEPLGLGPYQQIDAATSGDASVHELAADARYVGVDGVDRQAELTGDEARLRAGGVEREYLLLAGRQSRSDECAVCIQSTCPVQ